MIEAILSAVPRLLVSVAVFVALDVPSASFPKDSVAGEGVACAIPFPVSETVCGLLPALSVMVSAASSVPRIAGVNITLMVHFAPAAKDVPHVFVCE